MDEKNKFSENSSPLDTAVELELSKLEFPGEDTFDIENYIKKANIPESVKKKLEILEDRRHKIRIFMIVAICAFALLLVLGANKYVAEFLFFFQGALLLFITVTLFAICLTGIVGIFLHIDRQKVEENFKLSVKHSTEAVGNFIHKIFKL